ncbi:sigma-54-dependent Fis family transcriptional regulator [Plasticicumulans acidivorans]|uniref:DNA-binding protein Fis n=1 Tax=Plasticicumulans acidivorans TaxID=886464 RepID=A0A317MTS1_9GAMM|nr:sigma-54-dependent Fis family transcriptional regulator [Plasticicumulans acidivorans]PWV59867.1 DNA-binding protein Fis [Plasticicumulans acidivorans]
MTTERTVSLHGAQLGELGEHLQLTFEQGHISLDAQRMILLHTTAMGALRKELIDSLGSDRARGLLTRMGYASGVRDAEMARRMLPQASGDELMLVGPQLHALEGIVNVQPVRVDIDIARGRYYGEFIWTDAYESEVHQEAFGMATEPVCWMQLGYASGYTTHVFGRPVLYREVECCARGDAQCRIIGRPHAGWSAEEIRDDLRYFRPESFAEQMIQLQTQVELLRSSLGDRVTLGDMVGQSTPFRSACELIRKAAASPVTVLLLGETGVGKEMFARGLHSVSSRAEAPFVALNCAAIPEELIESELFGVEKGAFTGAQTSRPGRFERAHGGTLFLDEVGELSASAQAKLLRVLQEGELERVGDSRTRRVDVRVVAATNVDLQEAARAGRFRNDLYYRLSVFPVRIPPLRERREDIPLLVERFLQKHSVRHGKNAVGVSDAALRALCKYAWPGNIRELENIIERGVILTPSHGRIDLPDLFPQVGIGTCAGGLAAYAPAPDDAEPQALPPLPAVTADAAVDKDVLVDDVLASGTSLDALEARLLNAAVERSDGNLTQAARLLGITRPQLAYRLKKLGGD